MSDLVPLVAGVLKDRALIDMAAEQEKLRRLVDDRLRVQITGKLGSPVYREGSLKDGYSSHRGRCFEIIFDDDENDETENQDNETRSSRGALHLTDLGDLEVRLGGCVVERLNVQNTTCTCNSPFFTDDDFYRDPRYNKERFIADDRKEVILKVKTHVRPGTVPFVIARFGDDMELGDYKRLRNMNMAGLMDLSRSGIASTIHLEGLTFNRSEIVESLSVLDSMGYTVDTGNDHKSFVRSIDEKRLPVRRRPTISKIRSAARDSPSPTTMERTTERAATGDQTETVDQGSNENKPAGSIYRTTSSDKL